MHIVYINSRMLFDIDIQYLVFLCCIISKFRQTLQSKLFTNKMVNLQDSGREPTTNVLILSLISDKCDSIPLNSLGESEKKLNLYHYCYGNTEKSFYQVTVH